jgi:hypothetical protein
MTTPHLIVGLLFLFGPELGLTLWPSPIPAVLMRFIGAIIVGNGVGAWLAARQGTWEGARVIFTIALSAHHTPANTPAYVPALPPR